LSTRQYSSFKEYCYLGQENYQWIKQNSNISF